MNDLNQINDKIALQEADLVLEYADQKVIEEIWEGVCITVQENVFDNVLEHINQQMMDYYK